MFLIVWLTRFWLSPCLVQVVSISASSGCRLPLWGFVVVVVFFFPDYFLACVSCFVSAYSGELWTPLAMILHFLLSPLLNSFPLSFHTQLHQPSAVDHLLCQPFFSPKKKKKTSRLKLSTWCWCAVCFLCWWMDGKCEDTPREEIIPPDPVFTVRSVGRAWDWA